MGVVSVVSIEELLSIKSLLQEMNENDFIDQNFHLAIERSPPIPKVFNGIDYMSIQVKYPVLVHKFGEHEILTEIIIREKQYAVGIQPMLYFCFPVTSLQVQPPLIGRVAGSKETAYFIINKDNINIFMSMLKIFGTLTANHNKDIRIIIDEIIEPVQKPD
jgi:hypothetical protein